MRLYYLGTVKCSYQLQETGCHWVLQPEDCIGNIPAIIAEHGQAASGSGGAVEFQPECFAAATIKAPDGWQHLDGHLPVRWYLVGDPAL